MGITATAIGSGNTVQVTATGTGNTINGLIDAVRDAVIGTAPTRVGGTGWTCPYDAVTGSLRTQIYTALNKDGITSKYLIARWDYDKMELNTSTCTSATSTTSITEEAHTFFDCSPISFATQSCDIIVMVNPRWLAFTSFINNSPSLWSGVFETLRENPNDTAAAGYPCWAWVSATLPALGWGSVSTSQGTLLNSGYTLCSFSRTRSGSTGLNAAKDFAAACDIITYPNWLSTLASPPLIAYLGNCLGSPKFPFTAWSSQKLVLPIKPQHAYQSTTPSTYGTMCGLKMLTLSSSQGMNQITLTTDSDGNYSPTGGSNDHWLLNTSYKSNVANAYDWTSGWSSGYDDVMLGAGTPAVGIATTGAKYYGSSNSGLYVVDATTLVVSAVAGAGACNGAVKYDGERYVYAATATGLVRVDVADNSAVSLTCCTGGVLAIAISSTHVFCTPRTAATAPTCARITRASAFTINELSTLTVPTFGENIQLGSVTVNPGEGIFFALPSTLTTGTNAKLVRVDGAGSATLVMTSAQICASTAYTTSGIYMVTPTLGYIFTAVSGSYAYRAQFNPSTGGAIASSQGNSSYIASVGSGTDMPVPTYITKVAGLLVCAPRKTSARDLYKHTCGDATYASYIPGQLLPENSAFAGVSSLAGASSFYDGASFFVGQNTGFRIYRGINGMYYSGGSGLGRFCLPS